MWTPTVKKAKHYFQLCAESLLIVFELFTESMKDSPGFFWSAAESVSTLWKINKQDWETEGRLWSKAENNEVKRDYLHWFVFTVCAQVECWAVHEVNHYEILPGIAFWWSHTWSKIKGVNYPHLLKVSQRWEWMSWSFFPIFIANCDQAYCKNTCFCHGHGYL